MDAACNHCCYGVLWGEKPQFLHKRKVAVKGGVNRTCEWLHFGDKSSPDPCSGVEITLVGCLTSCITPKTTDVTRTAVTSVSGCNHRETDVKPPGLATLGTPTHAPRRRSCFTLTLSLLEPLVVLYPIHNTHATASSSCTPARYTSPCAHHRLPSREAAKGFPAVCVRTIMAHVTAISGQL